MEHSKKRLLEFVSALKGLQQVAAAAECFSQVQISSSRLRTLVTPGSWEAGQGGMCHLAPALTEFQVI